MAGTTRLELATSAVTDIKRCRRTSFDITRHRMSLLIVPLLYPDLAELLNFSNPFQNNFRFANNTRRIVAFRQRLPVGSQRSGRTRFYISRVYPSRANILSPLPIFAQFVLDSHLIQQTSGVGFLGHSTPSLAISVSKPVFTILGPCTLMDSHEGSDLGPTPS